MCLGYAIGFGVNKNWRPKSEAGARSDEAVMAKELAFPMLMVAWTSGKPWLHEDPDFRHTQDYPKHSQSQNQVFSWLILIFMFFPDQKHMELPHFPPWAWALA